MTTAFIIKATPGGPWRWITISSNSYQDYTGEIISQEALIRAQQLQETSGQYGPLLWWHDESLVLGTCDFSMMEGRFLIESGTFIDEVIPALLAPLWWSLGVSIGFLHPENEPVLDGGIPVYYNIQIVERSLCPLEVAANPFTRVGIGKENTMADERKEALVKLLGPEKVGEILSSAQQLQQELDNMGVAARTTTTTTQAPALLELLSILGPKAGVTKTADGDEEVETTTEKAAEEEPEEEETNQPDFGEFAEEVRGALSAITDTLTGLMAALQAVTTTTTSSIKSLEEQLIVQKTSGEQKGYRPTEDSQTVTQKAEKTGQAAEAPVLDPISALVDKL